MAGGVKAAPAASAPGAASARLRAGAARLRRLQLLPGKDDPAAAPWRVQLSNKLIRHG